MKQCQKKENRCANPCIESKSQIFHVRISTTTEENIANVRKTIRFSIVSEDSHVDEIDDEVLNRSIQLVKYWFNKHCPDNKVLNFDCDKKAGIATRTNMTTSAAVTATPTTTNNVASETNININPDSTEKDYYKCC